MSKWQNFDWTPNVWEEEQDEQQQEDIRKFLLGTEVTESARPTRLPEKLYLIGSLRNPNIPRLSAKIRPLGYNVFDDWYAAGERADDSWQAYEEAAGHSYTEALDGHHANHVYWFDYNHLESSDIVVLVLPAGRSAHLEFGFELGRHKTGYVLLPGAPERFDVMYKFANRVFLNEEDLLQELQARKVILDDNR